MKKPIILSLLLVFSLVSFPACTQTRVNKVVEKEENEIAEEANEKIAEMAGEEKPSAPRRRLLWLRLYHHRRVKQEQPARPNRRLKLTVI